MALFSLAYLGYGYDDSDCSKKLTNLERKIVGDLKRYDRSGNRKYKKLNCAIYNVYNNISLDHVYIKEDGKRKIYHNQEDLCGKNDRDRNADCKFSYPRKINQFIYYKIIIDNDMKNLLMFHEKYIVTLINKCGIDYNHRGSDHTDIELDFHEKWVLKDNFYKTFVDGLYRIKSHKFENNYEMFGGIDNVEIDRENKTIEIYFDFDHGS